MLGTWSGRAGQRVMASVRRFLESRLRLQVNEAKSKVARPEEIHFLGFRLRKKQRRPRYLYRHLLRCGVSDRAAAETAYCHRGVWYRSNTRGINTAYRNAWFQPRLVSLWTSWEELHPARSLASVQRLL
jgi:hypothetical protein